MNKFSFSYSVKNLVKGWGRDLQMDLLGKLAKLIL